jgi:hypothetical protein
LLHDLFLPALSRDRLRIERNHVRIKTPAAGKVADSLPSEMKQRMPARKQAGAIAWCDAVLHGPFAERGRAIASVDLDHITCLSPGMTTNLGGSGLAIRGQ